MSEGEVSQIQDEDVLRRMWQATDDFGRKKEIRAHMYRLREERLRNLYSPEPTPTLGKGCEFSPTGHGRSFADQTFQSMKSKEVRDAGSPSKEFPYRGQDLKELSNAGWNVESEDRTTNDGRTQVKFVNANIEGHYDVEGGRGQFAAVDRQRKAVTEHQDANSSMRRDEARSDSAAHEHVVRRTDDGATVSSTTSSSNTSSNFHQISSTRHEVPLEYYDSNEEVPRSTKTYDQMMADSPAKVVSKKISYPDDKTRLVVETRELPDGTQVISTRREFRTPVQSTCSEHHSRRDHSKSYSSHHSSDYRDSSSTTRLTIDNRSQNIVDSQRNADDYDFKRQLREYTTDDNDDYFNGHQQHVTKTSRKVTDHSQTDNEYSQKHHETRVSSKVIDQSTTKRDDHTQTQRHIIDRQNDSRVDERDRHHATTTQDHDYQRNIVNETSRVNDSEERIHNLKKERTDNEQIVRHDKKETVAKDMRNILNDKPGSTYRSNITKNDAPTSDSTYDIPRDSTAPIDQPRATRQKGKSPSDKLRDSPRDESVPQDKSHIIPRDRTTTDERIQHINTKEVEVTERKTSSEHHQTTYQNDYQSRKVSTDWSPTHQAWASTLRADSPTTRPSTRASSPGSRTYQSSTSSLRSSVSPDKTYRKPSSRGGSPNKVDRYSPTRTVTSDRYSSTLSTHSYTEERVTKNTSPERKPPTGRSVSGPSYSPDRKPQEGNRQRPSVSPDKNPQSFLDQPNISPERNPSDGYSRTRSPLSKKERPNTPTSLKQSPERRPTQPADGNTPKAYPGNTPNRLSSSPDRKPINSQPNRSSPRSSPSPDRKVGYQKPTDSNVEEPKTSSPSRPGYPANDIPQKLSTSPDRKIGTQKTSTQDATEPRDKLSRDSPVKRPSVSPDRKPGYMRPKSGSQPDERYINPSQEDEPDRFSLNRVRKPINSHPNRSSPRSSPSPDRKAGYQKPTDSNVEEPKTSSPSRPSYPANDIPQKLSASPDRKLVNQKSPTQDASEPRNKITRDSPTKRPSVSPDRKPGYMRPKTSQPDDRYRNPSQEDEFDRKSPSKQAPNYCDQKPQEFNQQSKIKDDHYRFVDEETKMYSRIDKKETSLKNAIYNKVTETDYSRPRNKSTSPDRKFPSEDTPDYCHAPESREMSINNDKLSKSDTVPVLDNDELYGRITKTVETIDTKTQKNKQTENITENRTPKSKEYPEEIDALNREPSKYGTYDKKKLIKSVGDSKIIPTEDTKDVKYSSLPGSDKASPNKSPSVPSSPHKKTQRDSVSPVKSPVKDTKYKHTTDFIYTEKTTEEINKQTTTKDRSRKLVTPSSSPTRKPKPIETEPSTGQSSPTTSVSGFVYFGSTRTEEPITDLDEFYPESEITDETAKKPETLDVKKSSSPSKIPCRSPSPEKHVPTTKDSLPRKSSLKKPTTDNKQASPVEKPPTSFRISPTEDKPIVTDHKKNQPSEPETGELISYNKPKPPLQRRETYDDRCKKILGLVDDTTAENITKETRRYIRKPDASQTSPSISPCDSPAPREPSTFSNYPTTKKTTTTNVTEFITHEKEDLTRTTTSRDQPKTKPQSRETSPAKLQDIKTKTNLVTEKREREFDEASSTNSVNTKYSSTRQIPEKDFSQDSTPKHLSDIPDRQRVSSPLKPQASRSSPEGKTADVHLKETFPTRKSLEKNPGYSSTITTVTVDNDHITTKISKSVEPTRVLESPEKDVPKPTVRTSSPCKVQPKEDSPVRKTLSPERDSPEKTPGYIKSTTHTSSQFDSNYTTETLHDTDVTKTQENKRPRKVTSPTRQSLRAGSPTKLFQSSDDSEKPDTPAKQTDSQKVPGYMRTTKTTTSKFGETTTSEDIQTTKTSIENKHTSVVPSSRTPTQYKSPQRTPSPTKPSHPNDTTIDKKSGKSSPVKENQVSKPDGKYPTSPSPTRSAPATIPVYMIETDSMSHSSEFDTSTVDDTQETTISKSTHKKPPKESESALRRTPKLDESAPEHLRTNSPSKPSQASSVTLKRQESPDRKSSYLSKEPKNTNLSETNFKDTKTKNNKTTSYMKTTTATSSKSETTSTSKNIEETTSKQGNMKYFPEISQKSLQNSRPRTLSPSKPTEKSPRLSATSPDRKTPKSPTKDTSLQENKHPKQISNRSSSSPEMPSQMKPANSTKSKFETTTTTHETEETNLTDASKSKSPSPRKTTLKTTQPALPADRQSTEREPKEYPGHLSKPEEPRQLRTPSPVKKSTTTTDATTDFIVSEREQEILNKVHSSLRKLSPERKEKSPSRERSPTKTTTSLQDLDIISAETIQTEELTNETLKEITEEQTTITSKATRPTQLKDDKPKDQKPSPSKPSSRNVSPVKRAPPTSNSNKVDKTPESPTKSRSFSPKKPISNLERPQSPQQPKASGIKPREQIPAHLTRKPTPATLSTARIDRLTTDVKKTNGVLKQSVFPKTTNKSPVSPISKINEPDTKYVPTAKSTKGNVSPKKDSVTRTASDIAMKPKKTASPQRLKSKPEIQVSDMSTKTPKYQKPIIKEPRSKLPSKPKSATSLNTSIDEDDIIIDVQQSKSSRENSPDRICPTPINFNDDVGIPRFPDEVSEPDDDIVKRTHQTIHETESVVDDIVEICEDEELFVKKSDMDVITEYDDSLLSVNDKVNKFTRKIHSVNKPKDVTMSFKEIESTVHSDFVDDNLKSDECLLSVSEKVNKFAKSQRDTKDRRSPSRKITDEYDNDTVYTDDYTKLSVNDKAHLFVETAENVKALKVKPAQKVERPDLSNVDESLKSDNCLLSVSDKVNKFVKTAEQYFTETQEDDTKETRIREKHEKILKKIVDDDIEDICDTIESVYTKKTHSVDDIDDEPINKPDDILQSRPKESKPSQTVLKDRNSTTKPADRVPAVKITTLRSSEAVKKAKALFENIASTQKITNKETPHTSKTTKLTDIGVIKKSPKTDSTTVLHSSVENVSPQFADEDDEVDMVPHADRPSSGTLAKPKNSHIDDKSRSSPNRLSAKFPEVLRSKSPMHQSVEITTTKTVLSRYPAAKRAESPRHRPESPKLRTESARQRPESDKPDKVPGYLRPTKTSQIKEEPKVVEEIEVSSRRGSGKFGVELRRTSVERSTVSSERRRSVEHHQPCIEDIFDLDLLEQMLEKVVGYEQRRRIRAQIRVAKNQREHRTESNTSTRTKKQTTTISTRSPERKVMRSPERGPKSTPQETSSPDRQNKSTPQKTIPDRAQPKEPITNGHTKEPSKMSSATRQRPHSPEKPKSTLAPKTPTRQPSPDKKRTTSPNKVAPKPKGNRFNEYASAYMKKVGLNEAEKIKYTDTKTKKTADTRKTETEKTVNHEIQQITAQEFTTTKSFTERTSSKDVIEIVQTNGKRSPSPKQRHSPERKVQFPEHKTQIPERKAQSPERRPYSPHQKAQSPDRKTYSPIQKAKSPERLHQRTPSPDFKRPKSTKVKETIIKTVYDIEKKIPSKPVQEEKPSWVTNRNLKKITSESRTFSSKKIESEKPKYRAPSPSKVITKPIDVITSSYGPGPLDADGKPLFGIKALRNGATNFQVKGTVIRQEFHSHNGGAPEGSVSVTAYSSQPEDLERLLAAQGTAPVSRLHGLSAVTTTKKFGGDTANTLTNVHTKEERASLEQFTHHDRRVEHLENQTYDSTSQDFGETRIEEMTSPTRRIEAKTEVRQDRNDRSTRREEKISEVKRQKVEERREKMEKREDKKTVRQNSVKSLTEKYIKSANDSGKSDRAAYPKAGLILRTTSMRDSVSSDDAHPGGLQRADSENSVCSVDDTVVSTTTERTEGGVRTTTTRTTHHHHHHPVTTHVTHHEPVVTTKRTVISHEPVITKTIVQEPVVTRVTQGRQGTTVTTERSFLDSTSKVTGVQDILTRMKNADIVIQEGDTTEDSEARALLNKFLGATVLMAGMQGYVQDQPDGRLTVTQESVRSSSGGGKVTTRSVQELDLDQCWDETLLKKLLEECTDYEQRRRLRARIRTLMAEQEACASAVTEALGAAPATGDGGDDAREEEEVTVTSSVRRDSSDKTVSSSTTTRTSKVVEMTKLAPKPVSPFAKFRQLEKQNSTNSPNSPKTPQSPGSPSQPYFKFTDPALQSSAQTIKERLLMWCRDKTRDYENVKLENFSTSWADGLAFCALVHHFLPDAFDYSKLTPDKRRHNFTLAFKVADEKAGIYPLLDVDDMVAMRKPDWKCVFTYVQAIYRRFKDEQ